MIGLFGDVVSVVELRGGEFEFGFEVTTSVVCLIEIDKN